MKDDGHSRSVMCSTTLGREVSSAYHISNRPPWKNESANDLADEVETAVLIRDSHDDTDRYEEEGGNGKREQ